MVRRSDLLGGGRFSGQRQRKRRGRPGAWSCWLRSFMASFIVNLGWLGSLTIWPSKHGLGSSMGLLLAEVEVVDQKRPGVGMNHLAGWTGAGSGSASGAGCWGGGVETGPISHLSGANHPDACDILYYTCFGDWNSNRFHRIVPCAVVLGYHMRKLVSCSIKHKLWCIQCRFTVFWWSQNGSHLSDPDSWLIICPHESCHNLVYPSRKSLYQAWAYKRHPTLAVSAAEWIYPACSCWVSAIKSTGEKLIQRPDSAVPTLMRGGYGSSHWMGIMWFPPTTNVPFGDELYELLLGHHGLPMVIDGQLLSHGFRALCGPASVSGHEGSWAVAAIYLNILNAPFSDCSLAISKTCEVGQDFMFSLPGEGQGRCGLWLVTGSLAVRCRWGCSGLNVAWMCRLTLVYHPTASLEVEAGKPWVSRPGGAAELPIAGTHHGTPRIGWGHEHDFLSGGWNFIDVHSRWEMAKEYVVQTSSNINETCSASSFSGPCAQHVVSFTPRAQRHQQQIPSDSPSWKLGTAEENIHFTSQFLVGRNPLP